MLFDVHGVLRVAPPVLAPLSKLGGRCKPVLDIGRQLWPRCGFVVLDHARVVGVVFALWSFPVICCILSGGKLGWLRCWLTAGGPFSHEGKVERGAAPN